LALPDAWARGPASAALGLDAQAPDKSVCPASDSPAAAMAHPALVEAVVRQTRDSADAVVTIGLPDPVLAVLPVSEPAAQLAVFHPAHCLEKEPMAAALPVHCSAWAQSALPAGDRLAAVQTVAFPAQIA